MIKLRLSRHGSKKRPFYHIVAADARAPRDGKFLEKLGTYNPMVPKDHEDRLRLNKEAIEKWLKTGAQPTERVAKFLVTIGLAKAQKPTEKTKKHLPKAKAQERLKAIEEKKKEAEEVKKQAAEEAKQAAAEAKAAPAEESAPAAESTPAENTEEVPAESAPEAPAESTPAEDAPEAKAEDSKPAE